MDSRVQNYLTLAAIWAAIAIAGAGMLAFAPVDHWRTAGIVLVAVFGSMMFVSLFAAAHLWRVEKPSRTERRNKRIATMLGGFLEKGQRLAHGLSIGYGPTREQIDTTLLDDVRQWANEVEAYLQRFLGLAHVARFKQAAIFPEGVVSFAPGHLSDFRAAWETAVRRRCNKLETFIIELGETSNAAP